jgi:hypothetical protein
MTKAEKIAKTAVLELALCKTCFSQQLKKIEIGELKVI